MCHPHWNNGILLVSQSTLRNQWVDFQCVMNLQCTAVEVIGFELVMAST
jgi:hypothetical protein